MLINFYGISENVSHRQKFQYYANTLGYDLD